MNLQRLQKQLAEVRAENWRHAAQILKMRNCDNCNEKGCEFSTPSAKEAECISENHRLWEMKP